ncbi:phage tail assembly chaperone [Rhodoligotrophos defluvii]|uniref:phage tail assembly chaperone n=1 Tax=Rhodoligotrophos defluvii TaxID=2561934 RepID=UPI0010C9EB45
MEDLVAQALKAAAVAGLQPGQFWELTPHELRLFLAGAADRERARYRRAVWAAWHQAGFARAKRMPSLTTVLDRVDGRKPRRMSPDDQLRMITMLNNAFGGEDRRKGQAHGR